MSVHQTCSAEGMAYMKVCNPGSVGLAEGLGRAGCGLESQVQLGEWQEIRPVN